MRVLQQVADVAAIYRRIAAQEREALKELAPLSKKKTEGELILALEQKQGLIAAALKSEDAKARKNAAIILGELTYDCAEQLIAASEAEETEFVRPSLILAIGRKKVPAAREYLKSYKARNVVEKHRAEEESALDKARSVFDTAPLIIPNTQWQKIALLCARGHADLTEEELLERDIACEQHDAISDCLVIGAEEWKTVLSVRTWYDALLILGRCRMEASSLANFLKKGVYAAKLIEIFGTGKLKYRVDVIGDKLDAEKREELIKTAIAGITPNNLQNSPSAYSFELVLMAKGDKLYIFARPASAADSRFAYRKNTLSASINPITAANMMRYIYPYLKRDANVIDPFCGTGTMLVERSRVKGVSSLTGVDIKEDAVSMAKENMAAAKCKANALHADILRFVPKIRYDECISNMPFGLRVSSHEGNERLYAMFLDRLPQMLAPGGMAFLYTNDKKLMRILLSERKRLTLVDEALFVSGNIHASLFIISVEE